MDFQLPKSLKVSS